LIGSYPASKSLFFAANRLRSVLAIVSSSLYNEQRKLKITAQHHFGIVPREYRHAAPASVFDRNVLTRLRFVLVWGAKVALSK
jgi:hypothetical protein